MRRLLGAVFLVALGACAAPARPSAQRVIASPIPTPQATLSMSSSSPKPQPTHTSQQRSSSAASTTESDGELRAQVAFPPLAVPASFRSLGAWIDVFDYDDNPGSITPRVREMAERGARTLYLETGRYKSDKDIQFPSALGAALDESKARGMRVVAWYPPAFDDVERDVRRSLAAIRFQSPGGNRFDAFGADIEYTETVADHAERSRRTVDYSQRVRAGAGRSYPLAAIVIAPTSLELKPDRWPGYPWDALGAIYDVFMPMNYWTTRGKDPRTAASLTVENVSKTRALSGGRPVHVIGGLAEYADRAQVAAYVDAALEAGSVGGSLYDFHTTSTGVWGELRRLNK